MDFDSFERFRQGFLECFKTKNDSVCVTDMAKVHIPVITPATILNSTEEGNCLHVLSIKKTGIIWLLGAKFIFVDKYAKVQVPDPLVGRQK